MNNFIENVMSAFKADIPLAEVLVISQVLFTVVLVGFVGYYFDRIKETLKAQVIESKDNAHER
jgi:hypothetical protein